MTLSETEDSSQTGVLPFGMLNSALVLQDADGNSIMPGLEALSNSQSSIIPSAINIENSSDVVIGPVTHFNGPVTIYQNVNGSPISNQDASKKSINGKLVKTESTSSDAPHPPERSGNNFLFRSKQLKYISISLILLATIVLVIIATILSLKSRVLTPSQTPAEGQQRQGDDGNNGLRPAGPGETIEKRSWGGRPALNFTVLRHPTPRVIVSHTVTPFCNTFALCSARVRSIQEYHVGRGSPDIGYNFLIGGDGNAYVGRGWNHANFHSSDSIGISFIGNYLYDNLTAEMVHVAKQLLEIGEKEGKLSKDYKLIGHNQTFATESPGPNVYKIIKTWPHFDPRSYLGSK